jgi:hypothetical protein
MPQRLCSRTSSRMSGSPRNGSPSGSEKKRPREQVCVVSWRDPGKNPLPDLAESSGRRGEWYENPSPPLWLRLQWRVVTRPAKRTRCGRSIATVRRPTFSNIYSYPSKALERYLEIAPRTIMHWTATLRHARQGGAMPWQGRIYARSGGWYCLDRKEPAAVPLERRRQHRHRRAGRTDNSPGGTSTRWPSRLRRYLSTTTSQLTSDLLSCRTARPLIPPPIRALPVDSPSRAPVRGHR